MLIMHRLHEEDLIGHVLAQEPWGVVCYPAIAEQDETHLIEAALETRLVTRARGEALHPEREPLDMLEQIRRTIGEYNFAGQYQQAPAPQGGGMVKAAWFASYRPNERPEPFDRIVQSWDTANKASELSDFSVCTSWGIEGKDLYLLYVLRRRMEYPELQRAVREQAQAFAADVGGALQRLGHPGIPTTRYELTWHAEVDGARRLKRHGGSRSSWLRH